ncbi:hypothetical protein HBB16_04385 [Pseudonocardia sp. MCCB 268]|nr:hypothetical protein [Pseudonocardia cytotoxica]
MLADPPGTGYAPPSLRGQSCGGDCSYPAWRSCSCRSCWGSSRSSRARSELEQTNSEGRRGRRAALAGSPSEKPWA